MGPCSGLGVTGPLQPYQDSRTSTFFRAPDAVPLAERRDCLTSPPRSAAKPVTQNELKCCAGHAEGHNIDLREDPDAALAAVPHRPALAYLGFHDAGAHTDSILTLHIGGAHHCRAGALHHAACGRPLIVWLGGRGGLFVVAPASGCSRGTSSLEARACVSVGTGRAEATCSQRLSAAHV